MFFLITARDNEGVLERRLENRDAHRLHIRQFPGVRLIYGAPLADESGQMNGTFLFVEADDQASVEHFIQNDPYAKAGVFASKEIRPLHSAAMVPKFQLEAAE